MTLRKGFRVAAISVLGLLALPIAMHVTVRPLARLTPPKLGKVSLGDITGDEATRRVGRNEVSRSPGLNLARLSGNPEELGTAHGRLLRDAMVETEGRFQSRFKDYVPRAFTRALLTDLAQARFFDIDQGMTLDHRREIAATAEAFAPDPFANLFPTYQRFVYLNALYDISLSFEQSPLLGCTTFFVSGDGAALRHTLFARNFDFEVDPVFDEQKTLFVVKEAGKIPYVSLSWPGLVGSVTGVNQRGLAMVVHGGRAGELMRKGEPVLHVLRDVLGTAATVDQAYEELNRHAIMVSHIIVMADPSGHAEVVERVPNVPSYRYRLASRAVVTNHLVGPSADDPKNLRIISHTSTIERQQRGQQLLKEHSAPLSARDLITFLRDRKAVNGDALPLGDRRALGALIAAHGVAMDLTTRRIWVGGAPTLLGRYFELSLDDLFDEAKPLKTLLSNAATIDADPLLETAEYRDYLRAHPR